MATPKAIRTIANEAELIFVPKGSDNAACRRDFSEVTDIEIPQFKDRRLKATSNGREFRLVKASMIGGLVAYRTSIGQSCVGSAGSDVCIEYPAPVNWQAIGQRMGRFTLLGPKNLVAQTQDQLQPGRSRLRNPLPVVTKFPKLLAQVAVARDLPLVAYASLDYLPIDGSVEIMPELLGLDLAADIVSSGETAQQNDAFPIYDLYDMYPAFIYGRTTV